jgi:glycosyltransferase involved in cell wall biosynthesis
MKSALALIVCIYNQRWILPTILDSVSNQQLDLPFEMAVCDDGSEDGALDVIKAWPRPKHLQNFYYVWQPNYGFSRVSASRNNGIRCTSADILVFVDGDICLGPSFLADHISAHSSGKRLVCGGRVTIEMGSGITPAQLRKLVDASYEIRASPEWNRQNTLFRSERPWMACVGANFSIERFEDTFFDERFVGWSSEDRDFAIRAYRSGFEIYMLPRINAIHVVRKDVPSRIATPQQVVAFLKGKLLLRKKYPEGALDDSIELARFCRYDPRLNQWLSTPQASEMSAQEILNAFEIWCHANGVSLPFLD